MKAYPVGEFRVCSIVGKGGSTPSVGMGLEHTGSRDEWFDRRGGGHTYDGRAVGGIPSDTDPRGDLLLGWFVLGGDDDRGGGELVGGMGGGLVVVEAESGHEFDERGQGGH